MTKNNTVNKKTSALYVNSSYYLPTVQGVSGYVLTSNGSNAPSWAVIPYGKYAMQTLIDDTSITWDLSKGQAAIITLGGARAIANPTNIVAGGSYKLIVKQDATGSRTLTYGTYFKFPGAITPVLTTNASGVDMIEFFAESTTLLRCTNVIYDSK